MDNQNWGAPARLAAALARHSGHPLSQAVARLSDEEIPLFEWREIPGQGVEGKLKIDGGEWQTARLGSYHWLGETGVDLDSGKPFAEHWSAQGATFLGLAVDQDLLAVLALKDTLKPGAKEVVTKPLAISPCSKSIMLCQFICAIGASNGTQMAGFYHRTWLRPAFKGNPPDYRARS